MIFYLTNLSYFLGRNIFSIIQNEIKWGRLKNEISVTSFPKRSDKDRESKKQTETERKKERERERDQERERERERRALQTAAETGPEQLSSTA